MQLENRMPNFKLNFNPSKINEDLIISEENTEQDVV